MKGLDFSLVSLDDLADEFAENEFVILEHFLSKEEVTLLVNYANSLWEKDDFHKAGIGNAHLFTVDNSIRGDYIKWIDKDVTQSDVGLFITRIEQLMRDLNRMLFLSMKDFECHFAIYPPGTFYEKHLDQFKSTKNRKISFACYLNHHWKKADGGELRLYIGERRLDVEPHAGRLVLFRSDTVPHEVLMTNKDRYSITGWMHDRPVNLPYYNIT